MLILLALFSVTVFSQNTFLSFTENARKASEDKTPVRTINDNGVDGMVIEYTFPGASVVEKTANNKTYQKNPGKL